MKIQSGIIQKEGLDRLGIIGDSIITNESFRTLLDRVCRF